MKNDILNIRTAKLLPKNSDFSVIGIVSKIARRKDRNDNTFWDLTISDSLGDMDGKAWSGATWWNTQGGEKFPIDPDNCGFRIEGMSIGAVGKISDFREQLQYNFNELYILDQSKYPPTNFAKHSPIQFDFLESKFLDLIADISHQPLQKFLNNVFFERNLWDKFKIWPAAVSLHHAYTGGLLEHSVSVALGAKNMAAHYSDFKIPVDSDLLIAGALLHDIGKIEAYKNTIPPQVAISGNIIEHVSLGYAMFKNFADTENLDENISLALAHIILSHHGKLEFGSPVLPETPEAMIVSAADDIDFKLSFWKNQIELMNPLNDVTDFLPMIERRLWRGISLK